MIGPIFQLVSLIESYNRTSTTRGAISVLVNRYKSGEGIGGHKDNEPLFGRGSTPLNIFSTAVGADAKISVRSDEALSSKNFIAVAG